MSLRARVMQGRLVLEEPAQLAEGEEYELVPVDEIDDAERAKLFGILADSTCTHVPGTGIPASELLATLRARR